MRPISTNKNWCATITLRDIRTKKIWRVIRAKKSKSQKSRDKEQPEIVSIKGLSLMKWIIPKN